MFLDRQGNRLTNAGAEAAAFFEYGLDAFNVYQGDPVGLAEKAIAASPDFAMAYLLKAYLLALATEPGALVEAKAIVTGLEDMHLDARERSHLAALTELVRGNWTAAAESLNLHNAEYPLDLLGLQCGHLMDFYRANARNMRDRIARVLPQWSPDVPGYPILLGMYAFGLEEAGNYEKAEAVGRQAVEFDPRDCWAHHAVAHVIEMQGRAADGIDWMTGRLDHWSDDGNFFKVHNWWHLSLYHLDLGQSQQVLELYDGQIRRDRSSMALDLVDASAILWRLMMAGHSVGDRWKEIAESWDAHADAQTYPFNDWHAAMAYLGASRYREVEEMIANLRKSGTNAGEISEWASRTALPLIEGFAAFWQGDYQTAVSRLHGIRYIANSFGGSHAQRDIIDWTLTEAAIRGGMPGIASALANERIEFKPHSPINRDFLGRARALGDRSTLRVA